jgi:BirA family biotin operon repressor/biotin-[acetyl-CoA-carboxylase] ligase
MMGIIGNETIRLKEVDSTNRYLMEWLAGEMPEEGTLVIADHQTAGRGTDGTSWESEPSMNLTFSFVLYPDFLPVEAQFYLNKTISLGLADLMTELLPGRQDVRIKWPNDIYIGDKKVAGTLIQNGVKGSLFEYALIGIGLNVNQVNFHGGAPNPVSLKMIAGKSFELEKLLKKLTAKIDHRYEMLKQGKIKLIDDDYLKLLYRLQQFSGFVYKGNIVQAKIIGVTNIGRLILEIPEERILECNLDDIKFEL